MNPSSHLPNTRYTHPHGICLHLANKNGPKLYLLLSSPTSEHRTHTIRFLNQNRGNNPSNHPLHSQPRNLNIPRRSLSSRASYIGRGSGCPCFLATGIRGVRRAGIWGTRRAATLRYIARRGHPSFDCLPGVKDARRGDGLGLAIDHGRGGHDLLEYALRPREDALCAVLRVACVGVVAAVA